MRDFTVSTINYKTLKNKFIILLLGLSIAIASCNQITEEEQDAQIIQEISEDKLNIEYGGIIVDNYDAIDKTISSGTAVSNLFINAGVDPKTAYQLNFTPDSIFSAKRVKAGKSYTIYQTKDSLQKTDYIVYHRSLVEHVVFDFKDSLDVSLYKKPVTTVSKIDSVKIESSMWNAIVDNNLNLGLAGELSEIYAWVIDFFGIQVGDGFKVYYDENYVDSTSVGISKIHAAVFNHNNKEYYAYYYKNGDTEGFWDENGNSLKKAFLKAPLKFTRISSGFTYARKHPVYKVVRPHTGVDYAAPKGTPVMSIGDGKVILRAYKGGGGNTVYIKHNSVYKTGYLHLSAYAKGLKVGDQVKQGQVIGYVGSTGASTGPHLDFRVWKNGTPINPLKMESPSVEPIPAKYMEEFKTVRDSLNKELGIKKEN